MTRPDRIPVEVGQTWAYNDARWGEHRYLAVTELAYPYVYTVSRQGKRTRMLATKFGRGARWTYCGHEGPGSGLPAFSTAAVPNGCLSCPPKPAVLPLTCVCAVGCGAVTVTRDGEGVWSGDSEKKRLAHFELRARETPGDWRIRFESAMSEVLYQRQGDARWVLTFRGPGFA